MMATLKVIKLISLTNAGPASCTLRGYPTLKSFTSAGRAVPLRFSRSPSTVYGVPLAVSAVTLPPGGAARVLIGVGFYDGCDPRLSRPGRVVLTLPDDPDTLTIASFGQQALCAHEGAWAGSVFGADVDPYQQPN